MPCNIGKHNTTIPIQIQTLSDEEQEQRALEDLLRAWDIAEQRAPEGTEYLHAISYFMVIRDHVYQIQHAAIQAKALEEYLTWLLRDKTRVIGATHSVQLKSEFDRAQTGDDLGEIKAIEVGGAVPETVRDAEPRVTADRIVEYEAHRAVGERVAYGFAKAKNILIELLGTVETQRILEAIPAEASLEVRVNIGYRARRRRFQKEFMANLAAGLRNLPDGELRVRGRDGELKGDDARLSADMNITRLSDVSSLLDLEDVLRQMKEVHRRFLHDGRIQA
jgi:hypothetical protein